MVIRGLLRKFAKGMKHPEKIPPYIKQKCQIEGQMAIHRNRIVDWYEGEGSPDYNVLFLTAPYKYFMSEEEYYKRHSRWDKVYAVPTVLHNLGFEIDIYPYIDNPRRSLFDGKLSKEPEDFLKYDLIVGAGPKLFDYAEKVRGDVPIVLNGGGNHWRDTAIPFLSRLHDLQVRKKVDYQDYRSGPLSTNAYPAVADGVLNRGDSRDERLLKEKYPSISVREIPMSHPPGKNADISDKDFENARRNFVYYAGNGPVLKGLDLVLEAFKDLDGVELYVVGSHNKNPYSQFSEVYDEELNRTDHIHNVGWVEMLSNEYYEVTSNCSHLIYPTAYDSGGPPGAIISMIWQGIIPIVSEAGWADVDDKGTLLPDCEIETIREAVVEAAERSPDELAKQSEEVYEYARARHSRQNTIEQIETQLDKLLHDIGFYE